jgi:predicted nuclease of predicted toxin-antitoxin system
MPRTIRFHLDENVSGAIAVGLRQQGIDVSTTIDAGLLGAIDEEQYTHAIATGRVLFTQDRDFLRLSAAGLPHAGLVYCDQDSRTTREILDGLLLIWEALESEEMAGRVEFI